MNNYSKCIDEKVAFKEMKHVLEQKLGRNLTALEERKIKWLADCEYETIGVFVDLFKEI